jgi:signal transduction histidine kinase/ligand-binding sensor domain-containing protein
MSQYVHTRWGKDKGFVGGIIYAISQSDDGYLWLGTDRGLVRFDGERFLLIKRPIAGQPTIGPVRGLVRDSVGNLWIRPQGPQLLLYRDGQFSNAFQSLGFPTATITAMGPDNHGNVLFSGLYSQTMRFASGKFERLSGTNEASGSIVTSIAETLDGRIWMGTRDDGLLVETNGGRISRTALSLVNYKINALAPSANGGLWIGTDQGLRFLSTVGDISIRAPRWNNDNQVLAITKDLSVNIWAASSRGLIRVTPGGEFSFLPADGKGTAAVTAVYEDNDGSIWFGGSAGLERLQDGLFTTYTSQGGIPESNGGALFVDGSSRTWFAPVSGGLYCFDHGLVDRIRLDGLDHDVVYSIVGYGNDIWIGRQRGGLTRITRNGSGLSAHTFTQRDGLAQNTVYATYVARDGTVWAGTISGGLSRLKDREFSTYSMSNGLNSNAVNSIIEGYDGTIWVGTSAGLNAFRGDAWSHWSIAEGLPSEDVRSCFEDSKHILWVVTASGLAFLSDGKFVVPSHVPDQLRDQIFGMTEDNLGFLWLSTTDSVVRVNRQALVADAIRDSDIQMFGESDGLVGAEGVRRERSILTDKSGKIWVSVESGIAVADPAMILWSSHPIRVRIESIDAAGNTFRGNESPRMAARTGSVTLHFSSMSLDSPDRVWYRYFLEGVDRDWSAPVQMQQVSYNNLGAGAYRFRVMASRDGVFWNGLASEATFSIDKAYWETWWFRSCVLLALALAVGIIFRLRMIRLSRQLNDRFQERLAERTRIARELHDTLLQSLQGLMFQFQAARNMLPRRPEDAMQTLDEAISDTEQAIAESRDAIHDLRSQSVSEKDLATLLETAAEELAAVPDPTQKAPAFRIIVEGEPQKLSADLRDEVYRIAHEVLRNAFRHAGADEIEAEIRYDKNQFRLRIRDDGKGIDPKVLEESRRPGHWGLPGVRERAQRIGSQLSFWSQAGAGTEVELTIPAAVSYEGARIGRQFKVFRKEQKL